MKTRDLVLMAMYTAMFVVLEYLSTVMPILKMPQGGSIGLAGVAVMLAAYQMGFIKGFLVGVLGIFVSGMFDPLYIYHWAQVIFDYPLAYGIYAICALVPNIKTKGYILPIGVIVANFARFMSHNIGGWIFFADGYPGNVLWGVVGYNATYMIPTTIVTFILVMILIQRIKPNSIR